MPKWITNHFSSCLDASSTLFQLVHLSENGIRVISRMPQAVKVLTKVKGEMGNAEATKRIGMAERDAALAQTEIDTDFPVLHGLAVVGLWSWLEHFVKGFVALWICHERDALTLPAVQKLKVRLGDYIHLDRNEQAAYLAELLEQDLASPLKRGVARFESLLAPFSLDGSVSTECSAALFELQQVRNVIAHRNAKADRRIITDCPWLGLHLNQPLEVSKEMLDKYGNASVEYLTIILYRVGDLYGQKLRPT